MMRFISRAISFLLVLTASAYLAAPAGAYIYAGKRKKINCGVLVVPGASQPLGPGTTDGQVGDLFFLLDQRIDLKPPGWSFDNPFAPGSPSAGLPKSNPDYWKVDLRTIRSFSRMHVLYLPASGTVKLDEQDREKLRQFVDGGGVLWIDNAGTGGSRLDFADTFFITKLKFDPATGRDIPVSRHHPLLSLPFWLGDVEVAQIGSNWEQSVCVPGYEGTSWLGVDIETTVNFDVLYPVVMNIPLIGAPLPSIAANHYGSGRIVATANFAGRGCYLNYPFDMPSLKFAYNVIAWASSWTHLRKDPRHSGNSIDTVGGTKLLEIWSLPAPPSTGGDCAPVIYKNVAFYSSGDKLYALDIMPQEDLDQDGDPDDGLRDPSPGIDNKGQDIIWIWQEQEGSQLSSPSIVTAQDPFHPDQSFETVLVMSSSGKVYVLHAFPTVPGTPGKLADSTTPAMSPWPIGAAVGNLSPPLYQNGWFFAVDGQSRLHAKNPSLEAWNGQNPGQPVDTDWIIPDPGAYQGSSTFRCGPTFGFVKNETSGSVTGMIYWFGGPWSATGNAPTDTEQNDHIYGVPIYVCNDRLKVEHIDPTGVRAECRTSYRDAYISNIPEPVVQIQGLDVIQVEPNTRLASPAPGNDRGYIRITAAGQISPDAIVYATYALDYADRTSGVHWAPGTRMRMPLEPRSNSGNGVPATQIAGMPALGPDGMMFLNGTRQSAGAGGSVYGIKNDGTTQYSRWIYHLHSGVDPADLLGVSGAGIPIPGVVVVDDPNDPDYGTVMANPQAFSSPAIAGDKVFVTVTGTGGYPSAALLCFKANSDFVIRIVENIGTDGQGRPVRRPKRLIDGSTGRQMQVKVWQPDLLQPGGSLVTPLLSAVPVPRDMIDYERGVISFNNFDRLKLKGGVNNIMMTNTFTPSLPVWVFLDNVEVPIDFNTWGPSRSAAQAMGLQIPAPTGTCVDLSGWNNLLWYYIVPPHRGEGGAEVSCSGIHSSPVVIGDTVYFTCDDGYVYAIPAETGVTSGGQLKNGSVIWNDRVSSSSTTAGVNTSPAGSNGVLLISAGDGLHAYANMTTLVADSNRVIEVDGAGEASWSIDAITWPVGLPPNPNAPLPVTSGPINKPARVRYVDKGDLLIVNSGANQVCKVDKSGTVGIARVKVEFAGGNAAPDGYIRWMWDKFTDPKKLLRPGQPTYLRSPTDALYWQEHDTNGTKHFLVTHCLVADSGNHRIVDLTYRVELDNNWSPKHLVVRSPADPSTGFYLPELNWATVTDSMNERYVYESLQLVPNVSNGVITGHDIWAAVSNYRTGTMMDDSAPSRGLVQNQGLGGAIVALRYRLSNTGGWDYNDPKSGRIVAACDRIDWNGVRPLACPRYFQVIDRPPSLPAGNPERHLLICDNYGVYEAKIQGGDTPPLVIKAFTDRDYRQNLRTLISEEDNTSLDDLGFLGIPLVANCVQELPNGRWLITNGYAGSDETVGRNFSGEIFEVDLSGSAPNITWCAPTLYTTLTVGGGGGLLPPGTWKQKMQGSYVFQQPRSAFRQF